MVSTATATVRSDNKDNSNDESFIFQSAQEHKTKGNDLFSKGDMIGAIQAYESGLKVLLLNNRRNHNPGSQENDENVMLLIGVLYLNKSQCQLTLEHCANDAFHSVELAIQYLEKSGSENFAKYREKAVYRRSLARWTLVQESKNKTVKLEYLNAAASDLVELLHYNINNSAAKNLLSKIRLAAKSLKSANAVCIESLSDEGDVIDGLRGCLRTEEYGKIGLLSLFGLLQKNASRNSDITRLCFMIILHHPHVSNIKREQICTVISSFASLDDTMKELFFSVLARLIEAAAPTESFIASRLDEITTSSDKQMMHIDVQNDIPYNANEDVVPHQEINILLSEIMTQSLNAHDDENESKTCIKHAMSFVKVWLGISSSGLLKKQQQNKLTDMDKNRLKPKEFARVNKIEYLFGEFESVRQRYIASQVPLELLLRIDFNDSRAIITKALQINPDIISKCSLLNKTNNILDLAKLSAASFNADQKLGIKVFRKLGQAGLISLLESPVINEKLLASEVCYSMGNSVDGRSLLTSIFSDYDEKDIITLVQGTENSRFRSNITLSMAKLNLASKLQDNSDNLFETAVDLLVGSAEQASNIVAGLELLHYLSVRPQYKNWICSDSSILEALAGVRGQVNKETPDPSYAYTYLQILLNLSTSVSTIEREQVMEKGDMDYDSYLQLKKLNKVHSQKNDGCETKEVDNHDEDEAELFDKETDVKDRVIKLVTSENCEGTVDTILSILEENRSRQSSNTDFVQEIGYLLLLRLATCVEVRGRLIQVGVLKHCVAIAASKGDSASLSSKGLSTVHHVIAKLLISTNPSILPSSQKLGSVSHLIATLTEVHESSSSLLPVFEALLALTNLAGDESCQEKIGKNISKINYHIFSENLKVRQAAVECISNLACTQYVYTYFTGLEWRHENDTTGPQKDNTDQMQNLRLWVALSLDIENLDISRAALGALAMATSVFEDVCCSLMEMENFDEFMNLGHYSDLELMHRALVILTNILRVNKLRGGTSSSNGKDHSTFTKQIQFCVGYATHFTQTLNNGEYDTQSDRQLIEVTLQLSREIVTNFA